MLSTTLLVTACGNLEKGSSKVDPQQVNSNATITTGRVDNTVYQALMENGKYLTSVTRGLSASRLNSNYNLTNYENGLLTLSHDSFSADKYYFQEGQKIPLEDLKNWLGRKNAGNEAGLNPEDENSPIIFQQLLEHDFINRETQQLDGISLGIALNKVYYTSDGATEIDQATMESEGKRIANEILARTRQIEGLKDIPIEIGLFEQAPKDDLVGGHYFAKGSSTKGSTSIDKWTDYSEEYVSLPVAEGVENAASKDGINTKFVDFKNTVQSFFPNLSGVVGTAYYKENVLQSITIKIETKYYSKTEITSFTQYVGKTAESVFKIPASVEIQINSIEGPQAFLEKNADEDKMYAHIFN